MSIQDAIDRHEITYMRQRGWFDPAEHPNAQATIVGVGGIGSPTALALAKLGIPKLTLIDPDTVEAHNLPNQLFPRDAIIPFADGSMATKVSTASAIVNMFTPVAPSVHQTRIEEYEGRLSGVVIGGLDSMEARQHLWQAVKRKPRVQLLIDGRLAGEQVLVYAVHPCDPGDIEYYEATLYSDEDAVEAPCTMQSIIDVGFVVASLITRAVRRHYVGERHERLVWLDHKNLRIEKEERP